MSWKRLEKSVFLGLSALVSALGKTYVTEGSSEVLLPLSLTNIVVNVVSSPNSHVPKIEMVPDFDVLKTVWSVFKCD